MKHTAVIVLVLLFMLSTVASVSAQSSESIWIETNVTAYKTGETVVVTVKAISVTPIQGFTFQIRYDPACLKPVNAASPIQGMNGLSLPQLEGLVDASFASTTPQTANGVLAEVHFLALAGCQTNLTLESAGLAIRDASGFAAQLPGVTIGANSIALNIDSAVAESQGEQPLLGTPLPLGLAETESSSDAGGSSTMTVVLITVVVIIGIFAAMFVLYRLLRR